MRVSVIISTYNATAALEKVLWGYTKQSHQDFELVVADDGSTSETANLLDRIRAKAGLTIRHIWHDDRGFRKCTILNKAIAATGSDYIVLTDGDCIPRWDFLARHVELSEPNCLLSGGTVRLPAELSEQITRDDVLNLRVSDPKWLIANGLGRNKRLRTLTCSPRLAKIWDWLTTTRATLNGCNASAYKSDIIRVNGFDERMEYGGLDRELGERLINAGVHAKQVRHRAVCLHLHHERSYVREDALRMNRQIREATRRNHATWTEHGIEKARESQPARSAGRQAASQAATNSDLESAFGRSQRRCVA